MKPLLFVSTRLTLHLLSLLLLAKDLKCTDTCIPDKEDPCPVGWNETRNPRVCLQGQVAELGFTDITKACAERDAAIVIPDTDEMWQSVNTYMAKFWTTTYWIGVSNIDKKGFYTWDGESVEAQSVQWAAGHPKANAQGACAYIDTTSLDVYSADCAEKRGYGCSKPKGPQCGLWARSLRISFCWKLFDEEKTWAESRAACRGKGAALLTRKSGVHDQHFKKQFKEHSRMYIGLTAEMKGGNKEWKWANNAPIPNFRWNNYEPSTSAGEVCAGQYKHGTWLDWPCTTLTAYLCEKESRNGPSEVKMVARYSRPPSTIYAETIFSAVCTAFDTESGLITWTVNNNGHDGDINNLDPEIKHSHEIASKADGTCGNKTTSTLTFKVSLAHQQMTLSCYGYDANPQGKICTHAGKRFSFCDISETMSAVDILKEFEMRIIFHQPPSTLYNGTRFNVTCTAITLPQSRMSWRVVGGQNISLATLGTQTDTTEEVEKPGFRANLTTSILSFKVREDLRGMVLSCHDYVASGMPSECTQASRDVALCDISPVFQVITGGPTGPPKLTLSYTDFDTPVLSGTRITATCEVHHGGNGSLVWVGYFSSGPEAFGSNDSDSAPIRTYTEHSDPHGTTVTSVLEFKMVMSLSGLRIGCFAYDVRSYRPTSLECLDEELYCNVSGSITVSMKPPPAEHWSWTWILWLLLVGPLFVTTMILCSPLGALAAYFEGEAMAEGDHQGSQKTSDLKLVAKQKAASTKRFCGIFCRRKIKRVKNITKQLSKSSSRLLKTRSVPEVVEPDLKPEPQPSGFGAFQAMFGTAKGKASFNPSVIEGVPNTAISDKRKSSAPSAQSAWKPSLVSQGSSRGSRATPGSGSSGKAVRTS